MAAEAGNRRGVAWGDGGGGEGRERDVSNTSLSSNTKTPSLEQALGLEVVFGIMQAVDGVYAADNRASACAQRRGKGAG